MLFVAFNLVNIVGLNYNVQRVVEGVMDDAWIAWTDLDGQTQPIAMRGRDFDRLSSDRAGRAEDREASLHLTIVPRGASPDGGPVRGRLVVEHDDRERTRRLTTVERRALAVTEPG